MHKWVLVSFFVCLAGCTQPETGAPERPVPDPSLTEIPQKVPLPPLSKEARETQIEILSITTRDSLRRFAQLAETHVGFASNFEGGDHFNHWSLLRRTGVDPMREIENLFEGAYGLRDIGSEIWYIWPDFAAMTPEELIPERLSFQDRARLLDLIGEEGVALIRAGHAYPGLRTAISREGRWVYYLHDIGESETPE